MMSVAIHRARSHIDDETHPYISPHADINAGIWSLFAGATFFLGARLWCKLSRKAGTGIWYDDYILIASWLILFMNDILISVEYATGYVQDSWDHRMRIMINISSCGTLIGQVWTKTAFGVTLLRLSKPRLKMVLWFCMGVMHLYLILKIVVQWGKVVGSEVTYVSYRLDFYITDDVRDQIKEGGNILNLIMDFIFAVFPWLITWKLKIGRREKISLCITLSLGMIVAISTAIRTVWKDDDAERDEWYFLNNARSQVWYSSEICGTIIVQCVPILRPFLKEVAPMIRSGGYSFKRSQGSMFIGKSSKGQYSTRNSIPLQSVDRSAGQPQFSPAALIDADKNSPQFATSDEIMRGAATQAPTDPEWYGGPRKFNPRTVEVEVEEDIRNIPPPSPLTPSPGQLTHQQHLRPNDPVWPFSGDRDSYYEDGSHRTDMSTSAVSWLNDAGSAETLENGTQHGLAPRPTAGPPVVVSNLRPKQNRSSRWSDD